MINLEYNVTQLQQQAHLLRFLSARMTHTAQSGHPGMPLGMADVCTVLWNIFMNWSNKNPTWHNRDRFILSCGHGSALLYSILYCMGVANDKDLADFRQFGSRTPGHPEIYCLPGVELTTGPLGQGLAWGIGMAKAAMDLDQKHHIYIVCSDGDLMEGIAHEALALASLWQLNNICILWDDNNITIDGQVSLSNHNPIGNIFVAHGWEVIDCDGHNYQEIYEAIVLAKSIKKPVCIRCKTIIGYGLPQAGTAKVHGSYVQDMAQLKLNLGLDYDSPPEEILKLWQPAIDRGNAAMEHDHSSNNPHPDTTNFCQNIYKKIRHKIPKYISTRKINTHIINELNIEHNNQYFIIGSADLGESTCTLNTQNYLHFGVREHAMVATMGGMSIYGRHPILATFLVFLDYARPAIRLAALMKTKMTIIATHDSICVGEDGPTHQPIEQLNSYRIMPNVHVWRPSNLEEMIAAWDSSFKHDGPTIIACTRQDLEMFESDLESCRRGGYSIRQDKNNTTKVIATGSEVSLALKYDVDVISMPCAEVFEQQNPEYRAKILADKGKMIALEAGSTAFWHKYADTCVGLDDFGASGKAKVLYQDLTKLFEKLLKM
jgi:transketolase